MKKKAIEKIPYLGLKQVSRGQDVKYIGVTAVKTVGHEKHLFLEMYRNEKESMDIPVVRIALTKKDFGTYYPDKDTWTREKIGKDYYYGSTLVWNKAGGRTERNSRAKANILATEEDMQRIEKFCGKNEWYKSEWWEHIYRFQSSIAIEERRKAENRKYEKRQQALKDRQEHTPELPEAEILEMADRFYFHQKHYLYYKKHGCNSCVGIDGAIRKSAMLLSVCLLMAVDVILNINVLFMVPQDYIELLGIHKLGICEFFSILFILYEIVSVLKNMTLCGLPVPAKIKRWVQKFLEDMTEELPEENRTSNT